MIFEMSHSLAASSTIVQWKPPAARFCCFVPSRENTRQLEDVTIYQKTTTKHWEQLVLRGLILLQCK